MHFCQMYLKIYVTKIKDPMCVSVGMLGCRGGVCASDYAFRHASRYGAKTWHRGRGRAADLRTYFRSDPTKGQRSSSDQVALEMPYDHQI